MYLTQEEERMLKGEYGQAVKLSMEILTGIGSVYEAKRLVPVRSVHAGCAYPNFVASVELMEKFADLGGKFRTVTTANPRLNPDNIDLWGDLKEPENLQLANIRQHRAIEKMGVVPNWSCTPYFEGNLPRFGEVVSWVESSAIVFANSVIGARTNRTTIGVDVASAITGRIPEFGLLLDENRAGEVLVKMEYQPDNMFNYNNIGFIIGKTCSGKVPVIEGLPAFTSANKLKVMGAAAATRGGIALYHAVGITPEARTRTEAFKGNKPEYELAIQERDIKAAVEEMNCIKSGKIDAVLTGCPYPSIDEMKQLAGLLKDRKVRRDIMFCLFASGNIINYAQELGYKEVIESSGVKIFEGDCIVSHSVQAWGWKNIATNSAKCACTVSAAPTYLDVLYTDIEECVKLATT